MNESFTLSNAWLQYQNNPIGPKTAKLDQYFGQSYIEPFGLATMPLHTIKPLILLKFRKYLERKLSPQSVHHGLSFLRRIFKKAIQWELYSGQLPHFDMPKFDNRRMRFFTPRSFKFKVQHLFFDC